MKNTTTRKTVALLGFIALAGTPAVILVGCDDTADSAEDVGEAIDDAADNAGDAMDDAADNVEDAFDDLDDG